VSTSSPSSPPPSRECRGVVCRSYEPATRHTDARRPTLVHAQCSSSAAGSSAVVVHAALQQRRQWRPLAPPHRHRLPSEIRGGVCQTCSGGSGGSGGSDGIIHHRCPRRSTNVVFKSPATSKSTTHFTCPKRNAMFVFAAAFSRARRRHHRHTTTHTGSRRVRRTR
jgi:hypothetical protein